MSEYLDLNDDSREEQLRHADVLRKFEAHKRSRQVIVPTAIAEVKQRLRELGHPVTLFAEDHADRRERLRTVIAGLELDQEQLEKLQFIMNQASAGAEPMDTGSSASAGTGPQGATMVTQEQVKKETFYSPASDALVAARREIATFSFRRAQERLDAARRAKDSPEEAVEAAEGEVLALYANAREMALNSSQVGDDRPVTAVGYSACGGLLATGSLSGVVKVWDTESLENRGVLRGTLDRITGLCWHPDAHLGAGPMLLAAASAEGCVHVYDYRRYAAWGEGCGADEAEAGTGAEGGMEVEEDEEGARVQGEGEVPSSSSNGNNGSGNGSSSNSGGGAKISSGAQVCLLQHKLVGHHGMVTGCAFHPSGRFLGSTGADGTWRLWDVEYSGSCAGLGGGSGSSGGEGRAQAVGTELLLQDGHAKECSAMAFHPDGSLVLTGDAGGVALLWDLRSGQSVQAFQGHVKKISSACFNVNGFQAATSSLDNSVKIWDLRRRRLFYTLPAHTNIISSCAYSRSGELLLTASFDGSLRIFGSRSFQILRTLTGHSGRVMACAFAPDERHVASVGFDRTIKLWAHKDEF